MKIGLFIHLKDKKEWKSIFNFLNNMKNVSKNANFLNKKKKKIINNVVKIVKKFMTNTQSNYRKDIKIKM